MKFPPTLLSIRAFWPDRQATSGSSGHVFASGLLGIAWLLLLGWTGSLSAQSISFSSSGLSGESSNNPTSLQFGPDDRLYVAQQNGVIYAYTVDRDNAAPGSGSYTVTATETIDDIKFGVPNHNDDGSGNSTTNRQVTGLMVTGTAANPVLYVTSSDWRIAVGNDTGLDTNSGVITRLTWNGTDWDAVDLVRGFPRCEENHSINGLDLDESTNTLYVMVGGSTNKGAPSNNFSGTPEYFFSGALVSVDLNQINSMPVYNDPRYGNRAYVYDLPTLNDPTRADLTNADPGFPYPVGHPLYNASIDPGDPFGGNNGYNQAIPEPGGPVQVYSGGYRNAYDVVFTESGHLYSSDNGPNGGWGGTPMVRNTNNAAKFEPLELNNSNYDPTPTGGDYLTNEFNESNSNGHGDMLHHIPAQGYYAGHPAPIRAFPALSGIYIYEEQGSSWVETDFRNFSDLLVGVSGYFNTSLDINDFPDNPDEGFYLASDVNLPNRIDIINSSTNGIAEYRAANNFNGAMQGDILTVSYNGNINRYKYDPATDNVTLTETGFLSGFGSQPLDVTTQGDGDIFPGTIWAVTYGADNITVFEPNDFGSCPQPGELGYDPLADSDGDGFTNGDEVASGTNHCNGGSQPTDNDGDGTPDVIDDDDDNDGILDVNDAFALDPNNGTTTDLPINYPFWNNDPGTGLFGVGFTGLMSNGSTDYLNQFDENFLAVGGATGKVGIEAVSPGDAYQVANDQEYAFQFGLNVDNSSPAFTVHSQLEAPFFAVNGSQTPPVNFQSYGIFIGTGDQDNYLKVVMKGNNGVEAIQVLLEDAGTATQVDYPESQVGDLLAAGAVELYLTVDPAANTAQPYVSIDEGATITPLGTPLTLPASFLDPNDNQGLAVGIISTSTASGTPFGATWDFLNVSEDQPATLAVLNAPLDFGSLLTTSSPSTQDIELRNDGGPSGGPLTVSGVTFSDPDFSTSATFPLVINPGNQELLPITLTPNATGTKNATVSIIHDGTNTSPLDVTLMAEVSDQPTVLYRVNAGGGIVAATDGDIDWEGDGTGGQPNSSYLANAGSDNTNGFAVTPGPTVPGSTPASIFSTERWDAASAPSMQWAFPVTVAGDYTVRLYMGNGFSGTSAPGQRVFDVEVEGTVPAIYDNIDLSDQFGHQVGAMLDYTVNVTDGIINLEFLHVTENPLINGIEILSSSGSTNPPLVIDAISDQSSFEGDASTLTATATGGDPQENITWSHTGLPPGLDIEPTNGQIFGAIAAGAAANSPYNVTITATKGTGASQEIDTETFVWTVQTPPISTVLYRVNAGGVLLPSHDSEPIDWEADQASGTVGGNAVAGTASSYINITPPAADNSFGANLPGAWVNTTGYPDGLFTTERWSDAPNPDNMQWTFAVPNGDYTVNLLFAEVWTGAQSPGVRVFDVEIEGQLVLDDFDQTVAFGWATAGVETFNVTVSDGNLDIDFFIDQQNPSIKGIEILEAGTTPSANALATMAIHAGGNNLNASTFSNNSFQLTNNSQNGVTITEMTLDLTTGFLPEMVFDPAGTAGDVTAKPFQVNTNPGVTVQPETLGAPLGNGGFQSLTVPFTGFDPGETLGFSIDADPTSIEGLNAPGPNDAGSVSGLELAGATLTVTFSDGSVQTSTLFSDGSNAGAVATAKPTVKAAPTLALDGAASPATVSTAAQTLLVTGGEANGTVSLLQVEAGFFEDGGNLNPLPFEVNSVISVNRTTGISLDANGEASIPVTLLDTDPEAGYNYFLLAAEDGSDFGLTSNPVIALLDPNAGGALVLTNPGDQTNAEGQSVTLPITVTGGTQPYTYSASGLPPSLTIDPATGLISGTIDAASGGSSAFQEQNGLVVIEMESAATLPGSWETASTYSTTFSPNLGSPGSATGGDFIIWQAGQNLGNPGVGQITYQVEITTTGVYQFQWRSQVANGTVSTEHNDSWLKIEADAFYGSKNGGASIVCPNGTPASNDCQGSSPAGSSGGGWFKIYSSGSTNWTWSTNTSDNDPHQIFARFDAPGVYNILVSARSSSHAIDRMVLSHVSAFTGSATSLSNPESLQSTGTAGAAANSPYSVTVTATDATQPTAATQSVNFLWTVNPAGVGTTPSALVEVTPNGGLGASTYGSNSFFVTNTGDVDITNVTIDLSTTYMMDVVFDPVGTAGDFAAQCLAVGNQTVGTPGFLAPANVCADVHTLPHNGVDNDEGYLGLTLDFNDFNENEVFVFGIDIDPLSIKGDLTAGDAGSISGFELIGATVTITYANGTVQTSSLFDNGTLGGSEAIFDASIPAPAPSLAVGGNSGNQVVNDPNQTVTITGTPGASVTLLQVDARLYIDPGNPSVGYNVDPFEANEAMAKVLVNTTIGGGGTVDVPVTLLQTAGAASTPDGGFNHFIAVENGPSGQHSLASNTIVLEYDPNAVTGEDLTLTATLQGRADHSAALTVTTYAVGSSTPLNTYNVSSDAAGTATITGLPVGTYQIKVKAPTHLALVQTVTIAAGTNAVAFGQMLAGDANNDNFVTSLDFSILSNGFNTAPGDANYQPTADFNGDGFVSSLDFSLLSSNFNTAGEEPIQ